jgi:tripartite ATP-independent transporter DctP family solute receptor
MKKWFKKLTISLVLPSVLVVSACGNNGSTESSSTAKPSEQSSASEIQERTLKLGISLTQDHPLGQGLDKFAEIMADKSGGQIKVQTYYDATLGDEKKMTEALQGGLQEATVVSTSILAGTVKEVGVYDYPFTFNNEQEAETVLDGPFGQKVLDKLPEQNLVGLGYWENGFRNVTNNKHPIETAEDFKGIKLRTMPNEVHLEVFRTLGANPTPMGMAEVFTALESGTIDGQENPVVTIEASKFDEVQKYLSLTKHVYTPFVFLVSKKFWEDLSDEEKTIFQEAVKEAGKFQRETARASLEDSKKVLEKKGMKINEVAPEERAKMQKLIQPVIDKSSKDLGEDLVKEFYDEVDKARQ